MSVLRNIDFSPAAYRLATRLGLPIDMEHAAPEKRWQSLQWQL
jgi:hypothetical protein